MIRTRRWGPAGAAIVLTIFALFFLSLQSLGQDINLTGASNCTAADFDANLQFVNGPNDYYTIVVDKRNISTHPCVFDGQIYGPSIVPDRVPGYPPIAICYDCQNRLPNGQYPVIPPPTLQPGRVIRQSFRWKTTPTSTPILCLQPDWISGPVLVVAPSLLKRICSDIEVSGFSLVSLQTEEKNTEGSSSAELELTSGKSKYYEGENFSVHVSLAPPGSVPVSKEQSCPSLYLKERSPDGTTRIDETRALAFKGCKPIALGLQPGDWQSGFELGSGANSRWGGLGEHTMEVFQLVNSPNDDQLHSASSNVLRIQISDPSLIPRKWGPHVKGVAADITLDKDTFRLGEDVPLHLAIENFDAEGTVYGSDPVGDPCFVVGIEVQNAEGHPLPANERFPLRSICTGHGFGPKPYTKGKLIALERTLAREEWLPNRSGTYTVVVTWSPTASSSTMREPYAIAHATATIHIVDSDTAPSK